MRPAKPWRLIGLACLLACIQTSALAQATTPNETDADQKKTPRLNILWVVADDISVDDLGCYGNTTIQTPNLDRLASEGIVFDNAWLTISSCTPSRNSMLTGRYPHNTGAPELHTRLPEGQPRGAAVLSEAGYHTVHAGKKGEGVYSDAAFAVRKDSHPAGSETWVPLLQDRPKDKPIFMWLASHDAHRDWQITDDAPVYAPEEMTVPPYLIDDAVTRQDLANYAHEVSRVDTAIGNVMAELKRQGIDQHTVVVFCADNGRPFPRDKTRLYASGMQTPLIVWCPAVIKNPGRSNALVSSIDLMPTLLSLAEAEVPEAMQGVSMVPVLEDRHASVRDVAFAEHNWHVYPAHERMVRSGDYLYIKNNMPDRDNLSAEAMPRHESGEQLQNAIAQGTANHDQARWYFAPRPVEQLFRTDQDPLQMHNLASDPEHAEALQKCRKLLATWTQQTGDTVPKTVTQTTYSIRVPQNQIRRGEMPGEATDAANIHHPGPVRLTPDQMP